MMQNPLLSYPAFSHFLELRHQQTAAAASSPPATPFFMYAAAAAPAARPPPSKSFTIDAILGLRGGAVTPSASVADLTSSAVSRPSLQSAACRRATPGVGEKSSSERKSGSSAGKCKRVRTIFTPEQLERLEAEFERQQYMVGPERLYLAHALQLTEAQVKVWFQNRRIKWRKQHLELQQQRLAQLKQQQQQQQLQQHQQQQPHPASSQQHVGCRLEGPDSEAECSNSGPDSPVAPYGQ